MTKSRGIGRGGAHATVPGDKYERLTVLEFAGVVRGQRMYRCVCECGKTVVTPGTILRQGKRKSCGCLKAEKVGEHARTSGMQFRHGLSRHPNYTLWQGIRRRCEDPRNKSWRRYGGRGIRVCERWTGRDGFPNFLADMGPQPQRGWHLHRIDGNGDYEPGNCQWLSPADHNAVHAPAPRVTWKLTAEIVRECRARYQRGLATIPQLRVEYGVTDATMRNAVNGRAWKHVTA
jgi:hypothetical protein